MSAILLKYFTEMSQSLRNIVATLKESSDIDLTTWNGISRAVKLGLAPTLFPIGTQFKVSTSTGRTVVFDAVGYNRYHESGKEKENTMTLQTHDAYDYGYMSYRQALFGKDYWDGTEKYVNSRGVYYMKTGDWTFTPTKHETVKYVAPTYDKLAGVVSMAAYGQEGTLVAAVPATLSSSVSGTYIGSAGYGYTSNPLKLNTMSRACYGSCDYDSSYARAWLNARSDIKTPSGQFDIPYEVTVNADEMPPLVLDEEFLNVVITADVKTAANNKFVAYGKSYKAGEVYTVQDKFYLPTEREVFGTTKREQADDGTRLLDYYKNATSSDRIKLAETGRSEKRKWALRSPEAATSFDKSFACVNIDGTVVEAQSFGGFGYAYLCTI